MSNYKPYWQKLQDPRWQKKRLEILQRENFTCQQCEDSSETLHVDHSYYEKGKEPWEYPNESLSCLCSTCHKDIENIRDRIKKNISRLGLHELTQILGYTDGLVAHCNHRVEKPSEIEIPLITLDTPEGKTTFKDTNYITGLINSWDVSYCAKDYDQEIENKPSNNITSNELLEIFNPCRKFDGSK